MTAIVHRDKLSGFFRAVCKDEACRATNTQRNYWRTGHLREGGAKRAASVHNAEHHSLPARAS